METAALACPVTQVGREFRRGGVERGYGAGKSRVTYGTPLLPSSSVVWGL